MKRTISYLFLFLVSVLYMNARVGYDVNGDGIVNGADVTALYSFLLNDTGEAVDVNGDGYVNGADVTSLYGYLLGDFPQYTLKTIAEIKSHYWYPGTNNYARICQEDIMLKGWVTSTDEPGNIFKTLYFQDETGGMAICVDAINLYQTYGIGQPINVYMKDLSICKYNGQLLIGSAAYSDSYRLLWDVFTEHVKPVGEIDVTQAQPTITSIASFQGNKNTATQLMWQNRLVKFERVHWEDGDGDNVFCDGENTANRNIVDEEGNSLTVTISNYSSFANDYIPWGEGNVTGLLYFKGADQWLLWLRDKTDCEGFPSSTKGLRKNPYTVAEAISMQDLNLSGWITGYIVGCLKDGVTSVTDDNIQWGDDVATSNSLVIADNVNIRDCNQCLVVPLPEGSPLATDANLAFFPELVGTQVWLNGILSSVLGTHGLVMNSGEKKDYRLSLFVGGTTVLDEGFENGIPDNWTQIRVKGNKNWYQTSFAENCYAAITGYKGTPPIETWLITPAIDVKHAESPMLSFCTQVNAYGSTKTQFEVYLIEGDNPTTDMLHRLNPTLAVAPASGYGIWAGSGDIDLTEYVNGTCRIGFVYKSEQDVNYATWCLDDVRFGVTSQGE